MPVDDTDNIVLRHLQELRAEMREGFNEVNARADERQSATDRKLADLRGLVVKNVGELVSFALRLEAVEADVARLKAGQSPPSVPVAT